MYYNKETDTLNVPKIIKHTLTLLVALSLVLGSFGVVKAGQIGVRTRFAATTGSIINPGLYVKLPIVEDVVRIDVQTQKEQVTASAASKDLQTVNSEVALNYSLAHESVVALYKNVGLDYKSRILDPVMQEAVKAVTSTYTAEELITKREEVSADIKAHVTEKLAPNGILVENFSIIDFDFSQSFNAAIEAKVTAEQNALAAKNKLSQVQYEAQQAVEEAKGKAEALRVESSAINSNPQILQLRAIEKWDGVLPTVTGGAVPFINVK